MSEFFDTPIADVITLQNDKKAQLKTPEYQSSGVLPIIDQSSKFICGYTDDFSKKYSKSLPVIVFGDHTLHTKYIDFDFAVGADGTQVIKTQDPHHQHKYLYYVISREIMMMGSEGYKRHLKILRERVVPFTNSVPEQKKIASILTSVDEVIESTQKQIDKLQDLKKATMNELLTKGIGHTEFKDSELGRIPKSWIRGRLDSVVSKFIVPMRDKPKTFSGDIPWVRIEDFSGKYLSGSKSGRNVDRSTINDMNLKVYPKGTVLCSCSARLGVCTITSTEIVSNQTFIGLYPSDGIDAEMLFYTMESHSEDLQKLSSGTTIAYLPREKFEEFEILVPPLPEQKKIVSILTSVDEEIESTQKKIDKLQDLKKALMQDLLTGKVRVTVN